MVFFCNLKWNPQSCVGWGFKGWKSAVSNSIWRPYNFNYAGVSGKIDAEVVVRKNKSTAMDVIIVSGLDKASISGVDWKEQ